MVKLGDQEKISMAQRGAHQSLLVFGAFAYLGPPSHEGAFGAVLNALAAKKGSRSTRLRSLVILAANAVESASHHKNKLHFDEPIVVPTVNDAEGGALYEQLETFKFKPITVLALRKHADEYAWVGPDTTLQHGAFGDKPLTHGAFVYKKRHTLKKHAAPEDQGSQQDYGVMVFAVDVHQGKNRTQTQATSQILASAKSWRPRLLGGGDGGNRRAGGADGSGSGDSSGDSGSRDRAVSMASKSKSIFQDQAMIEMGVVDVPAVDWFSWGAKMRYMTERVKKEKEKNENFCKMQGPVMYGQVVQLRHVRTGKFLTVQCHDGSVELADIEKECFKVELSAMGSEGSWFSLRPRNKSRTSAGNVYIGDPVLMQWESDTFRNFQLHTNLGKDTHLAYDALRHEVNLSNAAVASGTLIAGGDGSGGGGGLDGGGDGSGGGSTSADAAKAAVESSDSGSGNDDHGPLAEPASDGGFGWRLQLYSSVPAVEAEQSMQFGRAFRLYHPEAEAFVCASADKGSAATKGGDGSVARHAAYLQPCRSHTNPEDPTNSSTKQMFAIEKGDEDYFKQVGGTATWAHTYRLRHIASGKYLMVEWGSDDSDGTIWPVESQENDTAGKTGVDRRATVTGRRASVVGGNRNRGGSLADGRLAISEANKPQAHDKRPALLAHLEPPGEKDVAYAGVDSAEGKLRLEKFKFFLRPLKGEDGKIPMDAFGTEFRIQHKSGMWLSSSLQAKPRASNKGDESEASSFDLTKRKGIHLEFTGGDPSDSDTIKAFSVGGEALRMLEFSLAERQFLRTVRLPGPWKAPAAATPREGKQPPLKRNLTAMKQAHEDDYVSMLRIDPREAELRTRRVCRNVMAGLLAHRYTHAQIKKEMSSDDFWRDPIPSETKQAACRELKVMEELFGVLCVTTDELRQRFQDQAMNSSLMHLKQHLMVIADYAYKAITSCFLKNTRSQFYFGFRCMATPWEVTVRTEEGQDCQETKTEFLQALIHQVDPATAQGRAVIPNPNKALNSPSFAEGEQTQQGESSNSAVMTTLPSTIALPLHEAAALCLKNLTSDNSELLQKRVGIDTIDIITKLLKEAGPVSMFLEFLEGTF
jgi:uncharacterized membrane protein YgcG